MYITNLSNLWENIPEGDKSRLEKYIRNRLVDALAFAGSPAILRDGNCTAKIILEYNATVNAQ